MSRRAYRLILISVVICLGLYHLFNTHHTTRVQEATVSRTASESNRNICPKTSFADDVLLILRTGATESRGKIPTHLQTVLRCVPNFVIHSDYSEEIHGHRIIDVLDGVDEKIKSRNPDFELYNHLQSQGRTGLHPYDSIQRGTGSGGAGNFDNPGWKLDKWKFLPMADRAFLHRPHSKWFVFIESDTYLVWTDLLEYLSKFNSSQPYYVGKHMYVNDILFAYGGAGFAISRPAMEAVVNHRNAHLSEFEQFTEQQWAGDAVLGKALRDVGVDLYWAFPHLQGDPPMTLDPKTEKVSRVVWCFPAITFHHMLPEEIRSFWAFEQSWHRQGSALLRYADIFRYHIRPQLQSESDEWDNASMDIVYDDATSANGTLHLIERQANESFEHCRISCGHLEDCLQFSYSRKKCSIGKVVRLGRKNLGDTAVKSGWMLDRIDEFFRRHDGTCDDKVWFLPDA